MSQAQNQISSKELEDLLREIAGARYSDDLFTILKIVYENPPLKPSLNFRKQVSDKEYITKWVNCYFDGYNTRPSVRKGNPPTTIPDSLIKEIFCLYHPDMDKKELDGIARGHSLMMTIENIVGDLLEEYIASKLQAKGWLCCWGKTIKDVDFCKTDGTLLQVKNSDNSENNASRRVRVGTEIKKWSRRKSRKEGEYCWKELEELTQVMGFSEEDFRDFVRKTIQNNPSCLHIPTEDNNIKTQTLF